MLKRSLCLTQFRLLLKIWKKYWQITVHMYFNFWYCNPIFKAKQGHKLKFSCPKWTFCHMLEHSKLYSSPFSPAQHNCWERGESQHVAHILGTGIYFFKGVKEGNYENWGEENDLWTCSNCLNFFADFLFLQNQEFWAFKGPFSGEKTKRYGRRRYIACDNVWHPQTIVGHLCWWNPFRV